MKGRKQEKMLARRVKDWKSTVSSQETSFHKPGSNKK